MPLNLRTHGHGQGYLDVNGLIPELVDRIDFRKGPYRADTGDNALAGASFMSSVPRIAEPFVAFEAGQYGWLRVAAGETSALGDGELTLAGDWKTYDGPWELPENLQHVALYAKYSQPTGFGHLEASLWSYYAHWDPTEQIPERAIGTSICEDEFCALDTSATGMTDRQIATVRLIGDDWHATLYSQYYDWNMYSDPTYDYQIRQWDRRFVHGLRGQRLFEATDTLSFTVGGDVRYDDIHKVQVDHTDPAPVHRLRLGAQRKRAVAGGFRRRNLAGLRPAAHYCRTARRPVPVPHPRHPAGIRGRRRNRIAGVPKVGHRVEDQ